MKSRDEIAADLLSSLAPRAVVEGNAAVVDQAFQLATSFVRERDHLGAQRRADPTAPRRPGDETDAQWARQKLEKARKAAIENRERCLQKFGVVGTLTSDLLVARWERIVTVLEAAEKLP